MVGKALVRRKEGKGRKSEFCKGRKGSILDIGNALRSAADDATSDSGATLKAVPTPLSLLAALK
jgi:hypothetical protein